MASKIIGFIVIEKCEEYEQPLGLVKAEKYPPGGVLEWTDGPRAVFPNRKAANEAITRTEHYRLAFNTQDYPEKKFCKIVPLSHATP